MKKEEFKKIFWKQYILLEKELLKTDDYVTIDKDNYKTFSAHYIYLFLNICSEIDSMAYEYCKYIDKSGKCKQINIVHKLCKIVESDPSIQNVAVKTKYPYSKITFVPFQKFDENKSASWWQDYNKVKHNRADTPEKGIPNYQLANLKNVMYAISALYILCNKFFDKLDGEDCILDESKLFNTFKY